MTSRAAPAALVIALALAAPTSAAGADGEAPCLTAAAEAASPAAAQARGLQREAARALGARQFRAAAAAADAAERLAATLPACRALFAVEETRGLIWNDREQDRALAAFRRALRWARASGEQALEARALNDLADASLGGDTAAFLDYARLAYERDPHPGPRTRGVYQLRRSQGLIEMRDVDASEQAVREGLGLARQAGDGALLADLTLQLGYVLARGRRQREPAIGLYEEGIALARRAHAARAEALGLRYLGNQWRDFEPARARKYYEDGLAVARRAGLPQASLLKNLGITLAALGDPARAEAVLLEAADIAERENATIGHWQSLMELGRLLARRDPARSDQYFQACLGSLEAQNRNLFLEDYRASTLASAVSIYDDPYDLFLRSLMERGETERAFVVAERARARNYLDSLTGLRDALIATVPAEHTRAETAALQRVSEQQALLRSRELSAAERDAARAALRSAEDELQALRMHLAATHPLAANARYPHLWPAAELQQKVLAPDEALVAFYVGPTASARWIVRPGLQRARVLPPAKELAEKLRGFVEAVRSPASDVHPAARQAYALLMGDTARDLEGVRRLVVVPSGILHSVPFEALEDGGRRPLVATMAVAYAPSASSYAYLRTAARPRPSQGLLAVGDPVAGATGAVAERALSVEQADLLKPLPNAAAELHDVAGDGGRVLAGAQATEPALLQSGLADVAVLHFATHGLVDDQHPERSALALTPAAGSDGLLQVREIYGLRLSAVLVTLSACKTAAGKDVTGEGVMGLSRAFLYAGAGAVMASLWNVNDASTTVFMRRFYRSLERRRTITEATREAKLALLGDPRWSHPYYWAPFVVTGNAAVAVPLAPRRFFPWWPVAVAAVCGSAGTFAFARRRRVSRRTVSVEQG